AQVRVVRTDKGTKFLNETLHAYFAAEGILHQTSVARTPKQNGVVERRNRTLVEAARTMLSAAKVPLFFCAEAIATACFTQNRSLVIPPPTCQVPTLAPTVSSSENINQAETYAENDQVADDEFINIFSTPARPTEKHVHAVKRIFRYLRGTVHRGLWYLKDSSVALTAFTDADHAGC
nr:putative ribonuclease H-like domain-containing protein [Tanacetum cinerariifolium]